MATAGWVLLFGYGAMWGTHMFPYNPFNDQIGECNIVRVAYSISDGLSRTRIQWIVLKV
jgi:hypothetical protein